MLSPYCCIDSESSKSCGLVDFPQKIKPWRRPCTYMYMYSVCWRGFGPGAPSNILFTGLIFHICNEGDCLHAIWSLPLCPWKAPVEICNFLIESLLPRRKRLGALALFKYALAYKPALILWFSNKTYMYPSHVQRIHLIRLASTKLLKTLFCLRPGERTFLAIPHSGKGLHVVLLIHFLKIFLFWADVCKKYHTVHTSACACPKCLSHVFMPSVERLLNALHPLCDI